MGLLSATYIKSETVVLAQGVIARLTGLRLLTLLE